MTSPNVMVVSLSLVLATSAQAGVAFCPNDQDVDNYPFGWSTQAGAAPGPEDVDRNHNGRFNGNPNVICAHVGAGDGFATMGDGKPMYVFGFSRLPLGVGPEEAMTVGMLATEQPGPSLVVKEGQTLYLTLTNVGMIMRPDLFDPHTVHWHGYANAAPFFDGNPVSSVSVKMGSSFTYFYRANEPGTYMYHCHVEATEHMQMGMLGQLYVLPRQDGTRYEFPAGSGRSYTRFAYNDGDGSTGYHVAVPLQLADFDPDFHTLHLGVQPLPFAAMDDRYHLLNGRGYPDTVVPGAVDGTDPDGNVYPARQPVSSLVEATVGQRILLRISSLSSTSYHTLQLLGLPMQVVGASARQLKGPSGAHQYYRTNAVTLGGGESVDVLVDTLGAAPGTYYLYSRSTQDLNNDTQDRGGMITEIHVR